MNPVDVDLVLIFSVTISGVFLESGIPTVLV